METEEEKENDLQTKRNARMLRENSLIEPIIKNPFVHTLELSKLDKLKILFNGIFLMPIRLVSLMIILLFAVGLACIVTLGYTQKQLQAEPLRGWRRFCVHILRFCGRCIGFCFGFHKIKKNGVRAKRSEAPIFVAAPHSSFFDAWVFFVLGLPSSVSKDANAKIPLIGRLILSTQPILVSREDSKNKSHTINEIKKRASPQSEWPQTLVFPEGTTTNRTCLITFKPGAFIPGRPVQPVVVKYNNRLDTITWTWQGPGAVKCLFYTICQFNNKMEITYLPVYTPNENEKNDAKLFACNVRDKMAEHLHVRSTFHTYEDCRLMLKARELKLPFESGLIEFERIKEKLNINYENCKEILEKFVLHAKRSDGKMSLNDFSKYLDLPATGPVVQVFNLYDRDKDGYIEFREFLIGLSLLSRPANTEANLELAFNMFDNGKGHITVSDLQSILYSSFSMSPEEVEALFKKIDTKNDGLITYDEFKSYAAEKPEYAQIFLIYNELKILNNNLELDRLADEKKPEEQGSTDEKNIENEVLDKEKEGVSTDTKLTQRHNRVHPIEGSEDSTIKDDNLNSDSIKKVLSYY